MAAHVGRYIRWPLAALVLAGCHRPAGPIDASSPPPAAEAAVAAPPGDVPAIPFPAPRDAGPAPDAGPRPRRLTFSVSGDIVLSPNLVGRAGGDLGATFGPVASLLSAQAVSLADLRGPLVARPAHPGPRVFGVEAGQARAIVRLGYDALLVANDHGYDQGAAGLGQTVASLRGAGSLPLGAGADPAAAWAPQRLERDGIRVALLGMTQRVAADPGRGDPGTVLARVGDDPAEAVAAVTRSRDGADLVVVMVHGMRLREGRPTDGPRALVRALVDAGADLVVGTGNPAMAPVERLSSPRGEAVVAWSLGTLVSGQGLGWHLGTTPAQAAASPYVYDPRLRDGVVLHCRFDVSDPAAVRVTGLRANAVWTTLEGGSPRVVLLRNADPRVTSARLQAVGAALGGAVQVRP